MMDSIVLCGFLLVSMLATHFVLVMFVVEFDGVEFSWFF